MIKEVQDKLIFNTTKNGTDITIEELELSNFRFIKKVSEIILIIF